MFLSPSSPSATGFYAAIKDGHGLKAASRLIDVHHSVGVRGVRSRAGLFHTDAMSARLSVTKRSLKAGSVTCVEPDIGWPFSS